MDQRQRVFALVQVLAEALLLGVLLALVSKLSRIKSQNTYVGGDEVLVVVSDLKVATKGVQEIINLTLQVLLGVVLVGRLQLHEAADEPEKASSLCRQLARLLFFSVFFAFLLFLQETLTVLNHLEILLDRRHHHVASPVQVQALPNKQILQLICGHVSLNPGILTETREKYANVPMNVLRLSWSPRFCTSSNARKMW